VGVLSGFNSAVEIFLPSSTPPVARKPGFIGGMSILFPLVPIIVSVVALHLVRGGGSPPQESLWEMEYCGYHCFLHFLNVLDGKLFYDL
jgi:hypothetical protein